MGVGAGEERLARRSRVIRVLPGALCGGMGGFPTPGGRAGWARAGT